MSNSAGSNILQTLTRGSNDLFISQVSMLMLVDIGFIIGVNPSGRASVRVPYLENGTPIILEDIEVIGIGNTFGGFTVDGGGCACLLFAPRTTVPNVRTKEINGSSVSYSKDGIKALPITNGRDLVVNAVFTSEGTLNIQTSGYILSFAEKSITYDSNSGLAIHIDDTRDLFLYRNNEQSGAFKMTLNNNGFSSKFVNKDGDSAYSVNVLDDGTFTVSHEQPQGQGDPKILNKISINKEGAVSITAPGNISLSIDKDGNISLSTDGKLSIKASSVDINNGALEVSS